MKLICCLAFDSEFPLFQNLSVLFVIQSIWLFIFDIIIFKQLLKIIVWNRWLSVFLWLYSHWSKFTRTFFCVNENIQKQKQKMNAFSCRWRCWSMLSSGQNCSTHASAAHNYAVRPGKTPTHTCISIENIVQRAVPRADFSFQPSCTSLFSEIQVVINCKSTIFSNLQSQWAMKGMWITLNREIFKHFQQYVRIQIQNVRNRWSSDGNFAFPCFWLFIWANILFVVPWLRLFLGVKSHSLGWWWGVVEHFWPKQMLYL